MRTAHTLQTGFVGLQVGCVPKGTHAVAGYGLLLGSKSVDLANTEKLFRWIENKQIK